MCCAQAWFQFCCHRACSPAYQGFLFLLLPLLCAAVLPRGLAQAAVLQLLHSGLHPIQQGLQLRGPLRVVNCSSRLLLSLLPPEAQGQERHALSCKKQAPQQGHRRKPTNKSCSGHFFLCLLSFELTMKLFATPGIIRVWQPSQHFCKTDIIHTMYTKCHIKGTTSHFGRRSIFMLLLSWVATDTHF